MKIAFGLYAKKFRSFNQKDIGLEGEQYSRYQFHLYQQIFHIFFIPFWPQEKFWKVIDETGTEIRGDVNVRAKLNVKLVQTKSPIWSFAGIFGLLLALVVFFVVITDFNPFRKRNKPKAVPASELKIADEKYMDSRQEQIVDNPTVGDIYTFKGFKIIKKEMPNGKTKVTRAPGIVELKYQLSEVQADALSFRLKKWAYQLETKQKKAEVTISKEQLIKAAGIFKPSLGKLDYGFDKKKTKARGIRIAEISEDAYLGLADIERN